MSKTFGERIKLINQRLDPEGTRRPLVMNENRKFAMDNAIQSSDEMYEYIQEAMFCVSDQYTARTKSSGDSVKQMLSRVLPDCEFRYQGSVMTDTHIKGASDIDLLCLSNNYKYQTRFGYLFRYGDPVQQTSSNWDMCLKTLISGNCYNVLQQAKSIQVHQYPKSIKVDVVNGIWDSRIENEALRAVSILNHSEGVMVKGDYPFSSIDRINEKSARTNGRLKRMIRFLKNLKEDADVTIELSSFQLNAICYAIPEGVYESSNYIGLVDALTRFISRNFIENKDAGVGIKSVTGVEYPFNNNAFALSQVEKLYAELYPIWKRLHDQGDV